jgi:hypothetical protein
MQEIESLRSSGELNTPDGFVLASRLRYNLHCNHAGEILKPLANVKSLAAEGASGDRRLLSPLDLAQGTFGEDHLKHCLSAERLPTEGTFGKRRALGWAGVK